jgi:hypothetical protein
MNAAQARMSAAEHTAAPPFGIDEYADYAGASVYGQVARLIGAHATDKLIAKFGGRRLYIPIAPEPGNQLPRSIGMRAAVAMGRAFGRERIMIPANCDGTRRRARIRKMRANNISVSHIARELRCTERYVYKVLASSRELKPRVVPMPQTPATIAERLKRGRINHRP